MADSKRKHYMKSYMRDYRSFKKLFNEEKEGKEDDEEEEGKEDDEEEEGKEDDDEEEGKEDDEEEEGKEDDEEEEGKEDDEEEEGKEDDEEEEGKEDDGEEEANENDDEEEEGKKDDYKEKEDDEDFEDEEDKEDDEEVGYSKKIGNTESEVSQSVKTRNFLHKWAVENNIKSKPLNELLTHLNTFMKDIRKSGTSLKNTLRSVDLENVAGGDFFIFL